ncbi:DUF1508 domain-containing protein [Amycolatopsis anabasis]|uniref:DUF1508 domain-containing protein n=1 Tax=Amycolatopsis anabasis TaxID=1840409 RepID=UPI00131B8C0C|nr:DUF1508 domain-containing protein [Amycolatopsis anabasis]
MKKSPRFQLIGAQHNAVRWRLLGGNNTSLGLGAITYSGSPECLAGIRRLRAHLGGARAEFSHTGGGQWRWLLYADAELVALAGHAYGRKIEAKHGLERFLAAVPVATILGDDERIADWRAKYRIGTADNPRSP